MPSRSRQSKEGARREPRPWLEWAASATGLAIAIALAAVLGWNAVTRTGQPPAVTIETGQVSSYAGGFTVEIRAINRSGATAAAVQIEGVLRQSGQTVEAARARLDYVPGSSVRRGGLFFTRDPREHELHVRALGYADP